MSRKIEKISSIKIGKMILVAEFFVYPSISDLFVSVWHAGEEMCVLKADELALFTAKINSAIKMFSI